MASYPWIVPHKSHKQDIGVFPHLKRWLDGIAERPTAIKVYRGAAPSYQKPMTMRNGKSCSNTWRNFSLMRSFCLKLELFVEHALGEAVAGVEEEFYRTFFVLGDVDGFYVAHFHMIGNGGHGALVGFQHGDGDLGILG